MTDAQHLIPCTACPLRCLPAFSKLEEREIEFVSRFKIGELNVRPGAAIYLEGADSPHLFTLLSGWAFRYKTLADGRRQILNILLPGDFIGMQTATTEPMEHGVEALTDIRLCVFSRDRLWELFEKHPPLAYDLTWLAAREEQILDDQLLAVGRRRSRERVAYLLWHLYVRARESGLHSKGGGLDLPMSQQQLADTLGMSLVTFNKTLQRLRATRCVSLVGRSLKVLDEKALTKIATVDSHRPAGRPLL